MKIDDPEVKQKLLARLSRIEGQVRGVQNMLADERDCREIMQQLAAVHSAVQSASRIFLREYASACLLSPETQVPRQQMIDDMLALFDKTP